jgi:hypothetical protein
MMQAHHVPPPLPQMSGVNRFAQRHEVLKRPKNRLVAAYMDIVQFYQPKALLMEQVADNVKKDPVLRVEHAGGAALPAAHRHAVRRPPGRAAGGPPGCGTWASRLLSCCEGLQRVGTCRLAGPWLSWQQHVTTACGCSTCMRLCCCSGSAQSVTWPGLAWPDWPLLARACVLALACCHPPLGDAVTHHHPPSPTITFPDRHPRRCGCGSSCGAPSPGCGVQLPACPEPSHEMAVVNIHIPQAAAKCAVAAPPGKKLLAPVVMGDALGRPAGRGQPQHEGGAGV